MPPPGGGVPPPGCLVHRPVGAAVALCRHPKDRPPPSPPASWRLRGGRGATRGWHRRGLHQEHFIELPPGVGQLGAQTLPGRVFVFAR
jgi:hypothetical protein